MSGEASSEVVVTPVAGVTPTRDIPVVDLAPDKSEEVTPAPVVEAAPKVEKPKPEPVASKLSKIKEREAKAAAREAEVEKRFVEAQQKEELLKSLGKNPTKVLKELGLSFNDLATALLSEDEPEAEPSEIEVVKKTVAELKAELLAKDAKAKSDAEAHQARELDTAIANMQKVIASHVEANAEKYDLIIATENQPLVYQIMEESYNHTLATNGKGIVMPFEEACELAESYLTENYLAEAKKLLAKSKKLQSAVAPPKPPKTSFARTLSNQTAPQVAAASSKKDVSKMSHEERVKHAASMLRFN